ncbi:MAG: ACP S-malonyltransferase [Oscillospiraceae bacterium]|nr:ACP S-malonyltransferase [Oscillospiraceae bacterium]
MGKVVVMFAGQGTQHPGMGRELYEKSPAAREVFDCAEKIRPGTIEQIFSGSDEELAQTKNTQPCVFCVDLAAAAALKEAGIPIDMLAGFSLGELAALAFSSAVTYEEAFRLVCRRAELMQKASEAIDAGMVAVLKLSDDKVISLCAEFEQVYPVNFNCPGQVVIAGVKDQLELLKTRVKEAGGRAMPLKVGGGFHSPFMASASVEFAEVLSNTEFKTPEIPLYSNVTAEIYGDNFRELLEKQIKSPVLWGRAVENMILAGADTFIEAGPGKTLCGLVSRISDKVRVFNVEDLDSLKKTVEGVNSGA